MPTVDEDRNLRFGVLALESGLVADTALIDAMRTWAGDGDKSLKEILGDRGALDPTQADLLEATLAQTSVPAGNSSLESTQAAEVTEVTERDPQATPPFLETHRHRDAKVGQGTASESMGHSSGRYRIVKFHARGGLGKVSVAVDSEFGRKVALKEILRRHADDPVSRARFNLEAEITGKLEHPGIVPVYGRGEHEGGRPFYAMKFIRGLSLKDSAERFHAGEPPRSDPGPRSLRLRDLLGRFLDACDAIAYAHSRGVIHRDIKPANIMVGQFGETLVVDWGLAKPLDAEELGQTGGDSAMTGPGPVQVSSSGPAHESTLDGSAIGSPPYMSPEQAAGDLARLGPATDIFSLGATLHYVLTGHPPYEGKNVAEVLAKALVAEPSSPRDHDPTISRQAEAICRKAMARDPGRRYPTAEALAEDVRRWLADEPISAYPEPWTRRLARWSKRHRTAVASAVTLLLASGVALAISAVLIGRERDEARAQRQTARRAVDEMYTEVAEQWLEDRLDPLQRSILERAQHYYEGFARAEPADAAGRQEWGRANLRLGDVLRKLGDHGAAEAAYRRSIAILSGLAAGHPAVDEHRDGRAEAIAGLAGELATRTKGIDLAEAEEDYREAAKEQSGLLDRGASPSRRLALARTERGLAELLKVTGRPEQAETAHRRAIDLLEAAVAAEPASVPARQGLAGSSADLGFLLAGRGRPEEAATLGRRAIGLFEKLVAEAPNLPRARDGLARAYNGLALVGRDGGADVESEPILRRVVAINDRLADDFPDRPEYRRSLARGLTNLGIVLRESGRGRDAEPVLRRALDLNEKLAAGSPEVRNFRRDQARCLNNLAEYLATTLRKAEAEGLYRKAILIDDGLAAEARDVPEFREAAAGVRNNLGVWLKNAGRADEAIVEFEAGSDAIEALIVADPGRPATRRDGSKILANLGNAFFVKGRCPEAEDAYRRAAGCLDELVNRPDASDLDRLSLAICLSNRGQNRKEGNLPGAEDSLARSIALFDGLQAKADPALSLGVRRGLAAARNNLGGLQASEGRMGEAEANYDRSIALLESIRGGGFVVLDATWDLGEVLGHLADLRVAEGRPADAGALLDRAIQLASGPGGGPAPPTRRPVLRRQYSALAGVLLGQGDHAGAARAGEGLLKVADDLPAARAEVARLLARCVAPASADPRLSPARRANRAGEYADRSVALLREAVEAGDPGAGRLLDEDAFAPLRDRDGFKTLRVASADPAGRPGG